MSKIVSPKACFCVAVDFCIPAKAGIQKRPAAATGLAGWLYAAALRKILTDFVWKTMPSLLPKRYKLHSVHATYHVFIPLFRGK